MLNVFVLNCYYQWLNVFVSNCSMYLSQMAKCIFLKLQNVFIKNCNMYFLKLLNVFVSNWTISLSQIEKVFWQMIRLTSASLDGFSVLFCCQRLLSEQCSICAKLLTLCHIFTNVNFESSFNPVLGTCSDHLCQDRPFTCLSRKS